MPTRLAVLRRQALRWGPERVWALVALVASRPPLARALEQAKLPVLVDFFSPTCGPCHMIAPVIESLAGKYAGRLLIFKLDTTTQQSSPSRFGIRGVPTLLLFKGGKLVDQLVGAVPQAEIEQRIHALL